MWLWTVADSMRIVCACAQAVKASLDKIEKEYELRMEALQAEKSSKQQQLSSDEWQRVIRDERLK